MEVVRVKGEKREMANINSAKTSPFPRAEAWWWWWEMSSPFASHAPIQEVTTGRGAAGWMGVE